MAKNNQADGKPFEIPRPEFPKRAVVTGGMPYGNKELHFGHVGGMLVFADTYARFLIHPQLDALRNTAPVDKLTFGSAQLPQILAEEKDIESITFLGLCTDICVISNVMITKAFFPEIPLIVDAKGCAGVTPQSHKNALEAMKMCQITIVNE